MTKFWGRPTYLGALVVLPEGWDTHPAGQIPLAIFYHGHFQREVAGWRETPPDPTLPPADEAGIWRNIVRTATREIFLTIRLRAPHAAGLRLRVLQRVDRSRLSARHHGHNPARRSRPIRFIHRNSDDLEPLYGDAITYELLPYIEKTFRGIGPWARALYGGSTGGWEALAAQVFYPDQYNGAWANCPDPIDFHSYTVVDLYADRSAYFSEGPFRRTPRPGERDYLGQTRVTIEQTNLKELVLGTHSRSGGQWDIWEAVFSPVGADGYPQRIFDKRTGAIDAAVATSWRDHYDLVHIMERDWPALGPKLAARSRSTSDCRTISFSTTPSIAPKPFSNQRRTRRPTPDVDYGSRDEHCWSGDHDHVNAVSRLTYNSRFIRLMADHWTRTAPAGADTTSWRY